MKTLKIYEDWNSGNESEEEQVELINKLMNDKDVRERIISHLRSRGMNPDFLLEYNDPEEFVIEYETLAFNGTIPPRISYYIDDLAEIMGEMFGTELSWRFSPNGNCKRLIFTLEKPLDPRYLKVKNIIDTQF